MTPVIECVEMSYFLLYRAAIGAKNMAVRAPRLLSPGKDSLNKGQGKGSPDKVQGKGSPDKRQSKGSPDKVQGKLSPGKKQGEALAGKTKRRLNDDEHDDDDFCLPTSQIKRRKT